MKDMLFIDDFVLIVVIQVTVFGTLTPVINQLKLDIAWREMLTSCQK